jgi:hypothetical protein
MPAGSTRPADAGPAGLPHHQPLGRRHALPDDADQRGPRQVPVRDRKLSYTGEPIDGETLAFIDATFGVPACSMYGTTEVGVALVNYPGARTSR